MHAEYASLSIPSSYFGLHQYAGNVIVHGPLSPYDGEWYGGLKADDAEQFIQELLMLPVRASLNQSLPQ